MESNMKYIPTCYIQMARMYCAKLMKLYASYLAIKKHFDSLSFELGLRVCVKKLGWI